MDDGDRGLNQSQWYGFCKIVWGCIHLHMDDQMRNLGAMVSREVLERVRSSCENFRCEVRDQLVHLKDVHGIIVGG